ncbi:prephenate/arogenate dehydrogenase family protein [Hyphomicrobiales bacterium]|jgi:cyclohexadieny/prephenate dehydrogenase|nr:prephenate/arogenate dehydrogenase family protein [Hyphomicrobiales bacterium]MDG1152542.1 prephenate/arogenate dehydrogenase family protein [Hyphomicrobiales bacterium]MDG1523737.1 prephenate/arogenate dehydrogenase family protein [Hyphomicrobiales bacterium]MDG1665275.1 prephenate/arogenate dehydrogenase family protein [Hyphomicrobiales bacterium]|tara:strand:- start:86 stop:1006 length:921 start_codon:yes stop_codon:yes gene_type:complete
MNNTFEKVCIVGLGLIGGSIGLAIKRSNISNQITGYARSNSTLERAIELGLVDSVKDNLKDAVNNSDLVILATPLSTFRELVEEMSPFLKKGCIITDTGSAKLTVIEDLKDILPNGVEFVPGHPIAGTEESGPDAGFAELFDNRWCILTPTEDNSSNAVDLVKDFWESIGSKVEIMDPMHHDKVLAITSHIPHLIAFNIVGTANNLANVTEKEVVKYSAGGFRDFTRIAASDPKMWSDIFTYNSDAVLEMLDLFSNDLAKLKAAVIKKDSDLLFSNFEKTREVRKNIIDAGQEESDVDFGRKKSEE